MSLHTSRELRQGSPNTADPLVLDLGNPVAGNRWDLRRLAVVENGSPATARACTVFVVTPHGNAATFNAGQVDDVSTAGLPLAFRWSEETVVLQADDHILVFVYGLGTGGSLSIVANAQVEETRS
jgi:hypothetical protein